MNADKLAKMQQQVRIGGKGTVRRKKKVVRRSSTTDDKKLQSSLKKLSVNNISGIEEVNMIKDDGSVIHFNNPKVQASLNANTFAISGHAENKQITEMLPGILNHLGSEGFNQLKRLASTVNASKFSSVTSTGIDEDDDDVPELVEDFEAASKNETATWFTKDEAPLSMSSLEIPHPSITGDAINGESCQHVNGDDDDIPQLVDAEVAQPANAVNNEETIRVADSLNKSGTACDDKLGKESPRAHEQSESANEKKDVVDQKKSLLPTKQKAEIIEPQDGTKNLEAKSQVGKKNQNFKIYKEKVDNKSNVSKKQDPKPKESEKPPKEHSKSDNNQEKEKQDIKPAALPSKSQKDKKQQNANVDAMTRGNKQKGETKKQETKPQQLAENLLSGSEKQNISKKADSNQQGGKKKQDANTLTYQKLDSKVNDKKAQDSKQLKDQKKQVAMPVGDQNIQEAKLHEGRKKQDGKGLGDQEKTPPMLQGNLKKLETKTQGDKKNLAAQQHEAEGHNQKSVSGKQENESTDKANMKRNEKPLKMEASKPVEQKKQNIKSPDEKKTLNKSSGEQPLEAKADKEGKSDAMDVAQIDSISKSSKQPAQNEGKLQNIEKKEAINPASEQALASASPVDHKSDTKESDNKTLNPEKQKEPIVVACDKIDSLTSAPKENAGVNKKILESHADRVVNVKPQSNSDLPMKSPEQQTSGTSEAGKKEVAKESPEEAKVCPLKSEISSEASAPTDAASISSASATVINVNSGINEETKQ